MKGAVYNENDPFCAQWLRNLIVADLIAPGDVDERSIEDVAPDDWRDYVQVHAFAGIGIWSHSLRRSGWPDERPVWTGSCPCQPFSQAGKGAGFDDKRHLWPAWQWLIGERRPDVVLGEQVASKDGLAWFDLVSADLEAAGYAVGAVDLGAAGFGAPHIRQRLWFCGLQQPEGDRWAEPGRRRSAEPRRDAGGLPHGQGDRRERRPDDSDERRRQRAPGPDGAAGRLSDSLGERLRSSGHGENGNAPRGDENSDGQRQRVRSDARPDGSAGGLPDDDDAGLAVGSFSPEFGGPVRFEGSALGADEPLRGFWRGADWLWYRDGKYRPVESGTFPLAVGDPQRVGRLRAYGNALTAPVCQAFIEEVMALCP